MSDRPLNGGRLVAAYPVSHDNFVVLVQMDGHAQPWVTAHVASLLDTSWAWGHYFFEYDGALLDFRERAGLVSATDVRHIINRLDATPEGSKFALAEVHKELHKLVGD